MSHTPGPWTLVKGTEGDREFEIAWAIQTEPMIDGQDMRPIAEISVDNEQIRVAIGNDDCEADGHLIAAAPDLLEACRVALRIATLCGIQSDGGQHAFRAMDERAQIEQQIKAAIAKAEPLIPANAGREA